eukprot:CAMPEP_0119035554 /NCGR_PEP_ID=MMETSP1177-20130426/2612_1 /TAXON_ID=2985 /ORGANISM="Ochromonas sp, Strain CCMP1899" /LENGTH=329 /DNA_ID=CAMNT_0006993967 /DNA_START=71 /DNA_END=1060 /DNA_ORIENTATION=-
MVEQSENISLPTAKPEAFDVETNATIVPEQQTKLTRFTNLSSIIRGVSICVLLGVALIASQHHESQSSASKAFSALSGTAHVKELSIHYTNTTTKTTIPIQAVGAEATVNLGTAANYVILTKAGISSVPSSTITGDIAVSPAAITYITGFSLTADSSNEFSRSDQVTRKVFGANHAVPTPSKLGTAIGDALIAYTDAKSRPCTAPKRGITDLKGETLTPGVYCTDGGPMSLSAGKLYFIGSSTDIWIIQVDEGLTIAENTEMILEGGAQSKNIFWAVSGAVTLEKKSVFEGILNTHTNVAMNTEASLNGRIFAGTAVTLIMNTITEPSL